jgi:phosphate transport system substrate-binding protein
MAGSGSARRWIRGAMLAGVVVAVAASAGSARPQPAQAGSVTVLGAGSTWDQNATIQWAADAHAKFGITINYQGVGSTAGRAFYIENQVDFGDSDIPFLPDELSQLKYEHKTFQYLPTVAGGTAIMYNLKTPSGKRITTLKLDSAALMGIFGGTITSWTSPVITRQNPQLRGQLPNARIIPVVRADGSGTSAMFSDYLRQLQPGPWCTFMRANSQPCGQTSFWPIFTGAVGQKGSDGVSNYVQQQYDTITYVETSYALQRNFPVAYIKNKSGHYVFPSSANDATALTHARIQSDLISDLSGVHVAPEANAYPISGYSYMITPTKVQFGFTPQKGAVLGKYIIYAACAGQQKAAPLGYSPLTPVLVKGVFAALKRIPGAPNPPPLTAAGCPNPTITGANISGPSGNPGSSQGNSGSSSSSSQSSSSSSSGKRSGGGNKQSSSSSSSSSSVTSTVTQGTQAPTGLTLTAAQLAARKAGALAAIAQVDGSSSTPLALLAVNVLLIALIPWIIWHRRRQPGGESTTPPTGEQGV